MGLAASQARFLCITARKADCEFKSTELAQQKLELTNKMMQISNDYANAMNATKLIWQNNAVENDYGLTYSLLMMPCAMNGYDPYFITSPSGAIVLNNEYAAAARAAGISKAGGAGSQLQRDKFIAALQTQGMLTRLISDKITENDFGDADVDQNTGIINLGTVTSTSQSDRVAWDNKAGMGKTPPMDKGSNAKYMTLYDMMMNANIGGRSVDWAKASHPDGYTAIQRKEDLEYMDYIYNNKLLGNNPSETEVKRFNKILKNAGFNTSINVNSSETAIKDAKNQIQNMTTSSTPGYCETLSGIAHAGNSNSSPTDLIVCEHDSGVVVKEDLEGFKLLDILGSDIELVSTTSAARLSASAKGLLTSFAAILGYEHHDRSEEAGMTEEDLVTNRGLNVDMASYNALKYAYDMTVKKVLSATDVVSGTEMLENATKYNRICSYNGAYAVNLNNMLSAFLTYYDNMLTGGTGYVVGRTADTSNFVTKNSAYQYVAQADHDVVTEHHLRCADFFDMVYNNILEHGWREDSSIDDSEYLESTLKNGRYSMSSLNRDDGYYYQTPYTQTGYMVEVADTDAINRAEAEFSAMKAEITYKEDSIDMKTKKLDTEIAALSTEYDAVKNLISKGIEKTFNMFSS